MTGQALVSVIIPVFNGDRTLRDCLEAVCRSTYRNVEVLVVDDHSTDGSPDVVRQFPCRLIQMEQNRGAAAARNRGAGLARGDLLVFLDADIVIEPDTLEKMVSVLCSRPDVSALFGSYQKDTIPTNFLSAYKNLLHHYTHQTSRTDAATFCGGFGAVRRDAFLQCRGFDESRRSLEDIEFGYRLHRAGHKISLEKGIQVTHCKAYSFFGLIKSDVIHRAIPWTRIMLEKRIWRSDLNTKVTDVLGVLVAFLLLVSTPLLLLRPSTFFVLVLLTLLLVVLNRGFYGFVLREKGPSVAARTVVMHWCTYLCSGVGLAIGVIAYLGANRLTQGR
jgi:GT2 family glycosyltransferase